MEPWHLCLLTKTSPLHSSPPPSSQTHNVMDHDSSYSVETLLDATVVLYDECCTSSFKKEKTVSEFVAGGRSPTPVSQAKPGATFLFHTEQWYGHTATRVYDSQNFCEKQNSSDPKCLYIGQKLSVSFIDQSPLVVANHGSYTEGEGEGGVNYPLQTIIKWKLSYCCTCHLHCVCVCIHGMLNRLVIEHGITYHQ